MIVDDEILAIQDLEKLISWEDYGFQIVATATNSAKAIELYQKYHPEIIFADIRMPLMDGLKLSQTILSYGHLVRIILLTAYRDFDYAKKAIEIGVANYLLKHDINEVTVLKELDKIRHDLDEELQKNRILRQRFYHNIIEGKTIETGVGPKEANTPGEIDYALALIIPNLPFFEQSGISKSPIIDQLDFSNMELPEYVSDYDILNINGISIFVFIVKKTNSHLETRDRMFTIARQIQIPLKGQSRDTFSIVLTKTCSNQPELAYLYKKALMIMPYLVFFERGKIIYSEDFPIQTLNDAPNRTDALFGELWDDLTKLDQHLVRQHIQDLFEQVVEPVMNPEELKEIVNQLIYILEQFRKQNHLPSIAEKTHNGINPISGYNFNEIRNELLSEFSNAVEHVNISNQSQFSRKTKLTIQFIKEHYAEDLTVDKVAENLGFSGVYLSQLFKKETGKTFLEYLTDYRIEIAKKLLQTGDYKVYEVAEIVGYKTSQYFSQVFRKVTGVYPIDYREKGINP
jgi:two-component system response regulator YesN